MTPSPLNILAFGAGAIGTYIGGSLALAGQRVVFVEQPSVADDLRQRGMRLDLTLDERRKTKEANLLSPQSFVAAASLEDALKYWPFDVAIFALKSFDTPAALEGMKPFAEKLPPILCLSNGVDNEPAIADALGADKVVYGTVTSAIGRRAAGDIVLEKLRGIGIANGNPLSAKLVAAFNAAYLNAQLFHDAAAMKWSKMLTNLVANPSSAILDVTAAQVFADRRLYKLEIEMLRECLAVMKAQGIEVVDLPKTPVRALAFATRLPLWLSKPLLGRAAGSGRGGKMPSFHIDLHSGRGKSEVDYLHGAVVRAGAKTGVPTPVNQLFTETLLALTNGEIPLDEFAGKPGKLLAKAKKHDQQ
ncbi:MAG: 2-dehydropantoate 2-reductase [Anaerolineales bacterium]|jgi:2-dehydropantoate 2-reductase|nr:2-dehydropantoate 2-reductase [Anaerolineales bacterium]MDX9936100.1 2-dehydropantoate 2-reductase [Anaerolineales bacterium]GER79400.1 2-dehydropantoate 2-reductase [Candidatus Denitrolinea symbiosum]